MHTIDIKGCLLQCIQCKTLILLEMFFVFTLYLGHTMYNKSESSHVDGKKK